MHTYLFNNYSLRERKLAIRNQTPSMTVYIELDTYVHKFTWVLQSLRLLCTTSNFFVFLVSRSTRCVLIWRIFFSFFMLCFLCFVVLLFSKIWVRNRFLRIPYVGSFIKHCSPLISRFGCAYFFHFGED